MYVFMDFACHRPAAGRWQVGDQWYIQIVLVSSTNNPSRHDTSRILFNKNVDI